MTFSGGSIKQLGNQSAYTAERFGGPLPEGEANQANRMITTSSAARDRQAREALQRETEMRLGTAGADAFNFGIPSLGSQTGRPIVGTMDQERAAFEKNILGGLYDQESTQDDARDKITYNF
jgi:hypothetical protein